MPKDFITAVKERRTYYAISKKSSISNEQIKRIVEEGVLNTPSAFNSQSARTVLLLGEHHDKLWSIVKETLRNIVPAEKFQPTEERIDSFRIHGS